MINFPIIYKYICKEVIVPIIITLCTFTAILFLAKSIKLVELIVNKNVPIWDIVSTFLLLLPKFIEIALPMSLLIGTIIGIGRISSDSELLVIRGIGLSLKKLSIPILTIATFICLITLSITLWLRPWSSYKLGLALFEMAKTQASSTVNPGVFNELGPLTIYSEAVEDSKLTNVVISDRTNPDSKRTFIAKYGEILSNKKQRNLILKLFDGSIPEGHGKDFTVTNFEVNQINIPISNLYDSGSRNGGKKSSEMYVSELIEASKTHKKNKHFEVERAQRYALPASCLFLAIIAMILGIQPSRTNLSSAGAISVGIGISVILTYYVLFALLSALAESMKIPVLLGVWGPNILLMIFSIYLFHKINTEQWTSVAEQIAKVLSRKAKT